MAQETKSNSPLLAGRLVVLKLLKAGWAKPRQGSEVDLSSCEESSLDGLGASELVLMRAWGPLIRVLLCAHPAAGRFLMPGRLKGLSSSLAESEVWTTGAAIVAGGGSPFTGSLSRGVGGGRRPMPGPADPIAVQRPLPDNGMESRAKGSRRGILEGVARWSARDNERAA